MYVLNRGNYYTSAENQIETTFFHCEPLIGGK